MSTAPSVVLHRNKQNKHNKILKNKQKNPQTFSVSVLASALSNFRFRSPFRLVFPPALWLCAALCAPRVICSPVAPAASQDAARVSISVTSNGFL